LTMREGEFNDNAIRSLDNLSTTAAFNAFPSMGTFFLMSSLLVSFSFFKKVLRDPAFAHSRSTWLMYYVHRWLR
ncbi:hypothetical protein PMAYCL1PPCAC_16551, partial [Pristionchus mayeri]